MKYYFYRGTEKNFGDELNEYLLPRLLPGFFDDREDPLFLGIGSILFDFHPRHVRKIVFGAGYGGYTAKPEIDETWTVYNVRGPRTAAVLGLERRMVAADLAVLMHLYRTPLPEKRFKFSFIPHYQSLTRSDWRAVADEAGLHFIDPRWPVEEVLAQLEASEVVLAEAMHGAIVADSLRIPWIALLPNDANNRFKWFDWAEALDIELRPQRIASASLYELGMNAKVAGRTMRRFVTPIAQPLSNTLPSLFRGRAAASLLRAAASEPSLSPDTRFNGAVERLQDDIARLRRDYPAGQAI